MVRRIYKFALPDPAVEMSLMSIFLYLKIFQKHFFCFRFSFLLFPFMHLILQIL